MSPSTASALILLSAILLPVANSLENGFDHPESLRNILFFWSAEAPMTRELAKLPEVVHSIDLILQHFRRVENRVINSINTRKAPGPDDDIRPCNSKLQPFANAATNRLGTRGWPVPDITCVSDVFGTTLRQTNAAEGSPSPFSVDEMYEAMYESGRVFTNNIRRITNKIIGNFTNPDIKWNFPYETPSQRCVVHPAGGYRIGDTWYLTQSITNELKTTNLPRQGRVTVGEFPTVKDGKLGNPALMCLPIVEQTENRTDTTTLIALARGVFEASIISRLFIEDNPAVLRALDDSDLFVQQAEDALTASNIAILVLPLGLNLVPIALLAEVSTITMLLYTLMSDVLTVFPLGIKGIELINIGKQRHRSIFVRIAGASNGSRLESAAAEIQAAECRAHDNVLPAGVAFLVLSIIFLIVGIAGEVLARMYTMRQRQRRLEELKEGGFELYANRSSRSGSNSVASRGATPPPSLSSIGIQPQETVGSPFRNGSFSDSYDTRKKDKNKNKNA